MSVLVLHICKLDVCCNSNLKVFYKPATLNFLIYLFAFQLKFTKVTLNEHNEIECSVTITGVCSHPHEEAFVCQSARDELSLCDHILCLPGDVWGLIVFVFVNLNIPKDLEHSGKH